jgi:hypothetical protein
VIDTTSGTGVAGATVKVEGAVATTGSDGTFALQADVDVGESVLAEMPGYISARRVIRSIGVDGWAELEIGLLSITSPDAPPPPPT